MHCIGYWLAIALAIIVAGVWSLVRYGKDDWCRDCETAAIAGSSSAREDLIELYTKAFEEEGYLFPNRKATSLVDDAIADGRHQENDSSSSRSFKWSELFKWLRRIGIVLAAIFGGGAAAAGKKKE